MVKKIHFGKYRLEGTTVLMAANGHIMESFESEHEAKVALKQYLMGERFVQEKSDVWVIGKFVIEPSIGGMQIGEIDTLDMNQYNIIRTWSEEEHDAVLAKYYKENGCYPDT